MKLVAKEGNKKPSEVYGPLHFLRMFGSLNSCKDNFNFFEFYVIYLIMNK